MDFFRKLFGGGNNSSAEEAKKRLRLVLIHDRTDISPQLLENLRMEMIGVLTKYMEIDESKIEMDLDHDERAVALVANIPVLRIKRGIGGAEDRADAAPEETVTERKRPVHTDLPRMHGKGKRHR